MIELTRLNDTKISINPYQIEMMESNPDTIIVMNSGKKYLIKEKAVEIEKKFSNFIAGSIYKAIVHAQGAVSTKSLKSFDKREV